MDGESVIPGDELVKSLEQMVVTTSAPSASFQSLPREIRDKIYEYMYERPADHLYIVWTPRTTFAVNRQLYSEAQLCLLKHHVIVKVSMRLRPEFRAWMTEGTHTRGWLIQAGDSGVVTRFNLHHMHIQIGPAKKQMPVTSILLLDHEAVLNFCTRLLMFLPRPNDTSMSNRRLRVRITCLKPFENEVINKKQERDLFESLLTLWWSFTDVQITNAMDKEVASQTRKLLSDEKWTNPEDFLLFLYACDVTSVLAMANGRLQAALQICSRERMLIKVMNSSSQLTDWRRNPAIAERWNESLTQFLLIDMELYTRLAQAAKSAAAVARMVKTAHGIHSELESALAQSPGRLTDSHVQRVYLLSLLGRYALQFDISAELISSAVAMRPDDRRLHRERVILNILTNKDLHEPDLYEKADEFRSYPIGQSDFNTKLASAADLWGLDLAASPKEQQLAIIEGMRALNAGELDARIYI